MNPPKERLEMAQKWISAYAQNTLSDSQKMMHAGGDGSDYGNMKKTRAGSDHSEHGSSGNEKVELPYKMVTPK